MNQERAMDRMYGLQRHLYDATRKYYLLGRDQLLAQMELRPGDRVLEVACGTARNLIRLHTINPKVELYGLDASSAMLKTAQANLARRGLEKQCSLRVCLAEELSYQTTFGLDRPFDAIFFSYGLSMIPTWKEALAAALRNLKPGGTLYIVDFWDQGGLPKWFRALLRKWLQMFGVHFRPQLLEHLKELEAAVPGTLALQSVSGRYAYIATFAPRMSSPRVSRDVTESRFAHNIHE